MSKLYKTLALAMAISVWIPSLVIAEPYTAPFTLSVHQIIVGEAVSYTIPPERMLRIAKCESTMNPKAYNPKDVDGLPKFGLFQFGTDTFKEFAPKSGIEKLDIWSAEQQAHTTAYMLSKGIDRWGCK